MGRGDHSRITVGNLAYNVTEKELRTEMEKYGTVVSARIPQDWHGRSKGIGIVDFETGEEADKVYNELHEKELFGRRCYIGFDDRVEERDRLSRRSRERDRFSRRRRRRSDDYDYDYDYDRRSRDRYDRDRGDRYRHDYSRSRRRDRGRRERRRSSDSDDYR